MKRFLFFTFLGYYFIFSSTAQQSKIDSLKNLAGIYQSQNDYSTSLQYYYEAEKIKLSLNKKSKITDTHGKEIVEVEETGSDEPKKISKRTITEGILKPRLNEMFSMVKSELDRAGLIDRLEDAAHP